MVASRIASRRALIVEGVDQGESGSICRWGVSPLKRLPYLSASQHLPRVFERFYKVDASRAAESTGLGLGLSITKAIVERDGGTIGVTSEPGRTTFTILLPRSSAAV